MILTPTSPIAQSEGLTPPPQSRGGPDLPLSIEKILDLDRELQRRRRRIKGHHFKTFRCLEARILQAAVTRGPEQLGFLTATNNRHRNRKEMMRAFDRAATYVKRELNVEWTRLFDRNADGKPHLHAVVTFDFDIATGFSWDAYHERIRLDRKRSARTPEEDRLVKEIGEKVTTNERLLESVRIFRRILAKHGFSWRTEITPVRNPLVVARYLAGRYCAGVRSDGRPSRFRRIGYTKGFPKSPVPLVSPGQKVYREQRDLILSALGLDPAEMRKRFGRTWNWRVILAIHEIQRRFHGSHQAWPSALVAEVAENRFTQPVDVVQREADESDRLERQILFAKLRQGSGKTGQDALDWFKSSGPLLDCLRELLDRRVKKAREIAEMKQVFAEAERQRRRRDDPALEPFADTSFGYAGDDR